MVDRLQPPLPCLGHRILFLLTSASYLSKEHPWQTWACSTQLMKALRCSALVIVGVSQPMTDRIVCWQLLLSTSGCRQQKRSARRVHRCREDTGWTVLHRSLLVGQYANLETWCAVKSTCFWRLAKFPFAWSRCEWSSCWRSQRPSLSSWEHLRQVLVLAVVDPVEPAAQTCSPWWSSQSLGCNTVKPGNYDHRRDWE